MQRCKAKLYSEASSERGLTLGATLRSFSYRMELLTYIDSVEIGDSLSDKFSILHLSRLLHLFPGLSLLFGEISEVAWSRDCLDSSVNGLQIMSTDGLERDFTLLVWMGETQLDLYSCGETFFG